MEKKQKKKRLMKRRVAWVVLAIFLIIFLIIKLCSKNDNIRNSETKLIIGDNYINLKNKIIIDSLENAYLSYDDIKNMYDENIFYDEANKKLITTYNKHIAILELDKDTIEINDAQSVLNGKMKFIDNQLYLPFSDMGIIYDFDYSYSNDTNIVILDNISKEKNVGKISKKTKIKVDIGSGSKKNIKLNSDEKVTVFEKKDGYYKIRTDNGLTGLIKENRIADIEKVRHNMDEEKLENVNLLSKYSEVKADYENITLEKEKYNVVAPELLSIEKDNKIIQKYSSKSNAYTKYLEWVQNNNINLWATLTSEVQVSDSLLTYESRKEIINNVYNKMIENNYKVLNINFSKINDVNSFYRFIIEITPKLRDVGIKIVVTYNKDLNEEKISKIVDYVVKED